MPMDAQTVSRLLEPALRSQFDTSDQWPNKRPLLAHYTSLDALESMLKNNEVWFSNPLFMNDVEEVRFGFFEASRIFKENAEMRAALKTDARRARFIQSLDHYIKYYDDTHLLDTHVFCLSEHEPGNADGVLSMWRGYGGNGRGAAIVLDTAKMNVVPASPLIIAKVTYGSPDDRRSIFENSAKAAAAVLSEAAIPDEDVHLVALVVCEHIKLYALFTKHIGFDEEHEWRVVYMSERDTGNKLKPMLGYHNGTRGVEPKLKFKIAHIPGVTAEDLSFDKIVASILLGPSTSSVLAKRSVARMLEVIGRPNLTDRLQPSTLPLRGSF